MTLEKAASLRLSLLCVGSGLLSALAFSTHSTAWLVWISFVPWLYVVFRQQDALNAVNAGRWVLAKRAGLSSWLFGMGFYIGVIHWLKELHPLTWLPGVSNSTSLLIVYGGIFGISLVVSLWTGLLGLVLGALKPTGARRVLYPAILWMFMESWQALGDLSLPWARLAISQYKNLWLLQIVPHTGHLVIGALIIAFNAALARFVLSFGPDPSPKPYWHYPGFRSGAVVAGLVGANLLYGATRMGANPVPVVAKDDVQVAVVQGSIPQGQKWSSNQEYWDNIADIFKIYKKQSTDILKQTPDGKLDLLIWPESALPMRLRHIPMYKDALGSLARESKGYFISGAFDQLTPDATSPTYNAAALFSPQGEIKQWYYKRQLVPFGEFFPYRNVLESLPGVGGLIQQLNPMNHDVAAGQTAALFDTPFARVGTLICFESVYGKVARDSVGSGAELLVVVTNDGWYRDAIALYQHLGHAVLRSLENQRYLARAGNTGISAFVDPYGRILNQSLPLDRTALSRGISREALKNQPLTLYTRFGDWPLWLGFLLLLGAELKRRYPTSDAAKNG